VSLIRSDENVREAAIRNAIDAVYGARDSGGTMHDAGEAAASVVLDVTVEALRRYYRETTVCSDFKRAIDLIDNGTGGDRDA
jgi:hypothetical protein